MADSKQQFARQSILRFMGLMRLLGHCLNVAIPLLWLAAAQRLTGAHILPPALLMAILWLAAGLTFALVLAIACAIGWTLSRGTAGAWPLRPVTRSVLRRWLAQAGGGFLLVAGILIVRPLLPNAWPVAILAAMAAPAIRSYLGRRRWSALGLGAAPMEAGEAKEALASFARGLGIERLEIFAFDPLAEHEGRMFAACTTQRIGATVYLSRQVLTGMNAGERLVIFGHELGHYVRRHFIGGWAVFLGTNAVDLLAAWTALGRWCPVQSQLATLAMAPPVILLVVQLARLLTAPLANVVYRRQERQANQYVLEKTGDAATFISAMTLFAAGCGANGAHQPGWRRIWQAHPSLAQTIEQARRFAAARNMPLDERELPT